MNDDIMLLSNELIYDNKLKTMDEKVAKGRLELDLTEIFSMDWLLDVFNPDKKVIFLNYDNLKCLYDQEDHQNDFLLDTSTEISNSAKLE